MLQNIWVNQKHKWYVKVVQKKLNYLHRIQIEILGN